MIDVTSNALLTVVSLLDSVDLNSMHKDFLLQAWKNSIKLIKSPQFRPANHKVVNIERIAPYFIPMSDLRVRPWFGIVEIVAFDLLFGTAFINRCIRGIFPKESKMIS